MHVYASLDDAKRYLTDEGIGWSEGSTNDALALSTLESVSRHIDWWCRRSRAFGSGFGPRLGTNRYDTAGKTGLDLGDDLLETTTVTFLAGTASITTSTVTADDDYFLLNQGGGYDSPPYRRAVIHGQGTTVRFPTGMRVVEWVGKWGYQDAHRALVATLGEAIADDDLTFEVSASAEFSPGMTVLVDDEQMYVVSVTSGMTPSIRVDRGVNGTTAASHLDLAIVERYLYDPRVVDATMRLFARRWSARNAGADGSDGGGDVGIVVPRQSEETILRLTISDLKLMGSVVPG